MLNTKRTFFALLCVLILMAPLTVVAQSSIDPDIQRKLELIEKGQSELVRKELPALVQKYPNNPGVMYLQAVLTTNGEEAIKIYQEIVDRFASSDWADDALYRLYQYYYSIGLYKTADQKLTQLRRDYPYSVYVTGDESAQKKSPVAQKPAPQPASKDPVTTPPAPVKVPAKPPVAAPTVAGKFAVQVGAFSTSKTAQELRTRFAGDGYEASVITAVVGNKKMYKVWVGAFATDAEARKCIEVIRTKYNINSIVVKR
jgi:tetratricopeptide (TPR) repeat protein